MASSTTIPITRRNAKSESMLSVTPIGPAIAKDPVKAAAIPIVTQIATAGRKNRSKVTKTKSKPVKAFEPIKVMRLSNMVEPSNQIANLRSGGRVSFTSFSNFRIALPDDVISILSGLKTLKIAAGFPRKLAANLLSSKPSMTAAISPTRTIPPSAV